MLTLTLPFRSTLKKLGMNFYCTVKFPDLDLKYFCNVKNSAEINHNIKIRKGVGDINKVLHTYKILTATPADHDTYKSLKDNLYQEISILPNKTHPAVREYQDEPLVVHEINNKRDFGQYNPLEFNIITRCLNLMRTDKVGQTSGHKSYYFLGELAQLEEALIKYTVKYLLNENFNLVSVPDILPSDILKGCGMAVNSDRTQIYSLDPVYHGTDLYLSGTAEMALAGLLRDTVHHKNSLPLKLAAVSRCYRAETSNVVEERGIYRVHQFSKVEMFAVTTAEQSEDLLEYLRSVQEKLFEPLGFHMRVLDMPPHELGASAYRKYDIEAWMPGRKSYGEVSSCSNCTDYQSRRLNIRYQDEKEIKYVHTLNGTACAIPRMLIALLETHQDPKGKIMIPEVLQPFMNNNKFITKNTCVPELKLLKIKK